jgi:hypothetical protein
MENPILEKQIWHHPWNECYRFESEEIPLPKGSETEQKGKWFPNGPDILEMSWENGDNLKSFEKSRPHHKKSIKTIDMLSLNILRYNIASHIDFQRDSHQKCLSFCDFLKDNDRTVRSSKRYQFIPPVFCRVCSRLQKIEIDLQWREARQSERDEFDQRNRRMGEARQSADIQVHLILLNVDLPVLHQSAKIKKQLRVGNDWR